MSFQPDDVTSAITPPQYRCKVRAGEISSELRPNEREMSLSGSWPSWDAILKFVFFVCSIISCLSRCGQPMRRYQVPCCNLEART